MYLAAAAGLAPHAAHGEDTARFAAYHPGQGQLAEVERTGQVDVQHPLPLFRRDVGEQLLLGDARVAHQHIHPAQRLLGGAEGQLTAGPAGHVTLDGQYARQLLLQGCSGLGVGVVEHRHPAARRVECAGCCCADAPVAARDEDGAVFRRRGSALGLCRRFRLAFRCRCVLRRSADRRFPRFLHRRCGHSRFFRLGQGRPALFCLRPGVCKVKCQLKFVVVQESNPPVHYFRPQRLFVSKPLRRERKQLPPPRRSCALLTFSGLGRLCGAPGGICVVSTSFH